MDSLTIEIEEGLAAELRRRASRSGRSPAEEARRILQGEVERTTSSGMVRSAFVLADTPGQGDERRSPQEQARIKPVLHELGQPASKPFDLKAYRDDFWNFVD